MGRKPNAETPLEITIKTRNNQERNRIGEKIHNVLKGNPGGVGGTHSRGLWQPRTRLEVSREEQTE